MLKTVNLFYGREKSYKQLEHDNFEVIAEYNASILSALTLMGGVLTMLPILAIPFSPTKTAAAPAYLAAVLMYFGLYFLFRLPKMKKYTLYGLYASFSVFFLLAVYLSVVHSAGMRATILRGRFCLIPQGFIDRPARIDVFSAFWF